MNAGFWRSAGLGWPAGAHADAAIAASDPSVDVVPPTLVSTSPANMARNVQTSASVVFTYSETVAKGTVSFRILQGTTEVTSKFTATFSGAKLTFGGTTMKAKTTYTFSIPAGAVKDSAGNPTSTATTLKFSTK